jgi:putative (di)nucleoside polyphosphate hydrolase
MTDEPRLPYRPCVGIMLLNPAGDVFVARRIDTLVEAWQMPQGGIDEGEDPVTAAFREMEEEIGTARASILAQSREWLDYDLPEHLVGKVWNGRYGGQRQKWFAMRFEGTDADINLATEHPEFNAWQWLRAETLPETIVPFKRSLYEQVLREFLPVVQSLRK